MHLHFQLSEAYILYSLGVMLCGTLAAERSIWNVYHSLPHILTETQSFFLE